MNEVTRLTRALNSLRHVFKYWSFLKLRGVLTLVRPCLDHRLLHLSVSSYVLAKGT